MKIENFTEDTRIIFIAIYQLRQYELQRTSKKWNPTYTSRSKLEKILRGSNAGDIKKNKLNLKTTEFGKLKHRSSKNIKKLFLYLLRENYLIEKIKQNSMGGHCSKLYINYDKKYTYILNDSLKIMINIKDKIIKSVLAKNHKLIKFRNKKEDNKFITEHINYSESLFNNLFDKLKNVRSKLGSGGNICRVLDDIILYNISMKLPTTNNELKICGILERPIEKYGSFLINVVRNFIKLNKIQKINYKRNTEKEIDQLKLINTYRLNKNNFKH